MTISAPEKHLYENKEEKIFISRTLLEYQGTDYPIRHLEKWREEKDSAIQSSPTFDIIPVGGLLLLITWVLGQTTLILPELVLLGLVALLTASDESTYKLIVTTDKGEEITIRASNKKELKKMKSALETAIAHLGEE
jgi:Family of unknown function (DUF6232)